MSLSQRYVEMLGKFLSCSYQLCSRLTDTRSWSDSFVSWTSMLRIILSLLVRKSSRMLPFLVGLSMT